LNLNEEHIDDLIAKYLAGEAGPEEAIWLDDWKDQSEDNLRHFNKAKQVFGFTLDQRFDAQKMYQSILAHTPKESKVIPLRTYFTPIRIAASLIIVSLIGIMAVMLMRTPAQPDTIMASAETIQEQKLADGSSVALNKHSKLTVVGGFNGKQRKVKLEGEAFFEVVHDETKPFVIEAGGILIKDIGTSFNVKAIPGNDSVFVYVTEGIVELSANEQTLVLKQNESSVYIVSARRFIESHIVQANITSYKTKQFHFSAATLAEVTTALNAVYGPFIQLQNAQLAQCTISVDFYNESPETIVTIIAQTLGLEVEKRNDTYLLKGTSCTPY
jgi:ferric-dicitrate binding protein FerR (iron transport regulator)